MGLIQVLFVVLTIALLFNYINDRYFKMESTIAMMISAIVLSFLVLIAGKLGFHHFELNIEGTLGKIDFHTLLMDGMLSFLLFAGAMNINFRHMQTQKWEIGVLASLGTIASAFLVAVIIYYVFKAIGIQFSFIYAMLFGSLISPTDPIAVLAILKRLGAPKSLHVSLAGESLFNDGVGIVLFITTYQVAFGGHDATAGGIILLFIQQAIGGIVYGLILGWLGSRLLRSVNDYKIGIFVTIAITTGGYVLAQWADISGPLAMVVSGIFVGNSKHLLNSKENIHHNLHTFWEIIDELLNAILFLLIGFELLVITSSMYIVFWVLVAIPVVLLVRFITVGIPIGMLKSKRRYYPGTIYILTWGGLRGGLAIALALAIPNLSPARNIILQMTYAVVLFSILIQGTTVKQLVKRSKSRFLMMK